MFDQLGIYLKSISLEIIRLANADQLSNITLRMFVAFFYAVNMFIRHLSDVEVSNFIEVM